MKYKLSLLLTLFCITSAMAQPVAPTTDKINRTISVSGEAEVRVVPDQVLLSMTAEKRGKSLAETQTQNDATVKKLVDYAVKNLGIEERQIQTDFVNIAPQYRSCNYSDEQSGTCSPLDITYYSVSKGIQIRLKDPKKYEELVTKALEFGVNKIDDVQFISTELRKHRDTARDMAAKASQEKAAALATTLGMKVGKPITINAENYSSFYYRGASARGGNAMMQNAIQSAPAPTSSGTGEGDLALGQINVSAQVHVTYELE